MTKDVDDWIGCNPLKNWKEREGGGSFCNLKTRLPIVRFQFKNTVLSWVTKVDKVLMCG